MDSPEVHLIKNEQRQYRKLQEWQSHAESVGEANQKINREKNYCRWQGEIGRIVGDYWPLESQIPLFNFSLLVHYRMQIQISTVIHIQIFRMF